ncbi:hypothetical protein ACFL6Y_06260, partial [Elusimicrobiota bacterium]
MNSRKIALFSVSDMTDVDDFARTLVRKGWHIIATSDVCAKLKSADIAVESVESFTGITEGYPFPATLHPKMESALTSEDFKDRIELVYDIPYSLAVGNDVGGRTLLALAAKGNRIPVFTREDMQSVAESIKRTGDVAPDTKKSLIAKTYFHVCGHYLDLAKACETQHFDGMVGIEHKKLLNGENPYQVPSSLFASSYGEDLLSMGSFKQLSGDAPCYTNLADLDCILATLCRLAGSFKKNHGKCPHIAIAAKHGNPCGLAVDWDNADNAIEKALWGNPLAIWGGELITNFIINREQAALLLGSAARERTLGNKNWMLDVVASPGFDQEAVNILGKRPQRKLLENRALKDPFLPKIPWVYREVRGGFLRQPPFDYVLDMNGLDWVCCSIKQDDIDSLLIAWAVAYTSNHGGNEVALAKDQRLIGIGGGPSTVEAA